MYDTLQPTVKLRVEKRVQQVHRPVTYCANGFVSVDNVMVDVLQQWWSVTGLYLDDQGEWRDVPFVYSTNYQPQLKP